MRPKYFHLGFLYENIGVSDESIGVADENIGVADENIEAAGGVSDGSPMMMISSRTLFYETIIFFPAWNLCSVSLYGDVAYYTRRSWLDEQFTANGGATFIP